MSRFSRYGGVPNIGGGALSYTPPPNLGLTPDETQPFATTLGAMFNLENPLISYSINSAFGLNEDIESDPSFKPLNRMVLDNDLHYYNILKNAKTEDHYDRLKMKAQWEGEQRAVLGNAGITENLLAGLAVGMVDPLNLAVGIFTGGASSVGGAIFRSVASSIAVTGTNEYFLQHSQVSRTFEESIINVAADMVFSTALGMGAYGIARSLGVNPYKIRNGLHQEGEEHISFGGKGLSNAKKPGEDGYANDLASRAVNHTGATVSEVARPDAVFKDPRTLPGGTHYDPDFPEGQSAGASYNPHDHTIYYDEVRLRQMYDQEAWKNPMEEGATPLHSSSFPTYDDWFRFVLEHEYQHSVHKRVDGEPTGKYEDRINTHALNSIGNKSRMGIEETPITLAQHEMNFNRIASEHGIEIANKMKENGAFGRAFNEISTNHVPGEPDLAPNRMPLDDIKKRYEDEFEAERLDQGFPPDSVVSMESSRKLFDAGEKAKGLVGQSANLKKKKDALIREADDYEANPDPLIDIDRISDEINSIQKQMDDLDVRIEEAYRLESEANAQTGLSPTQDVGRVTGRTEHGVRHIQLLNGMSWTTKLVRAMGGVENLKFNPMLWAANSKNAATRLYGMLLVPTPVNVGNTLGHATPKNAETIRNNKRIEIVEPLAAVEKEFMGLRFGIELEDMPSAWEVIKQFSAAQKERLLRQSEDNPLRYIHVFNQEVSIALRSSDVHENPYVARAAKAVREAIDGVTKDAEDLYLFRGDTIRAASGELDLMGAKSYLPRILLQDVLDNHIEEFIRVVVAWQKLNKHRIPDNVDDKLASHIMSDNHAEHEKFVRKQALMLSRKLDGVEDYDVEAADIAGSLKGRSIWVDDNVIAGKNKEFGGTGRSFIENDVNVILKRWMPKIHTDIVLTEQFGSVDMATQFANVRSLAVRDAKQNGEDVITKTIDKPETGRRGDKKPALVVETTKSAEEDIVKLSAMRDALRGVYNLGSDPTALSARSARILRDFTNWALMGNVVVSSVPDAGRILMVNKMHGIKALGLAFTDFQKLRSSMREIRNVMGVGMEMALSSRAQSMVHQGDIPRYNGFERGMARGTELNFIINGLNPWNAVIKQAAGIATVSRMIDDFKRYAASRGDTRYSNMQPLTNAEITKLNAAGIDQDFVKQILALHDKYGEQHRGVEMPNMSEWDFDDLDFNFDIGETALMFRHIIQEEVDRQIVTPGAGDIPLWIRKSPMSDAIEKSLLGERMTPDEIEAFNADPANQNTAKAGDRVGQFGRYGRARREMAALYPALGGVFGIYKSFIAGSWSRVMIPSLQNKDSGEIMGIATMILLGGMAKTFKDWSYERPGPRNVKEFLVEGFDQSGLGSWFMFANSQGEALLDAGIRPMLGIPRFEPSLRWQTSTVFGANVGQLLRAGRAIGDVSDFATGGDFSSSDATNMYRLAPFNSLFYLRLHNLFQTRKTADEVFGSDTVQLAQNVGAN